MDASLLYKIASLVVLALFIPLTAWSYILSRRRVRKRELEQVSAQLELNFEQLQYVYGRELRTGHFAYAVGFTFVVTLLGLVALFLGEELKLHSSPSLLLDGFSSGGPGTETKPEAEAFRRGALLFFSMAFLGAYLWGLQNIIRRYFANDLMPGVYYGLGVRMIFAALVALLIYHMLGGQEGESARPGAPIQDTFTENLFPAIAFLVGTFPQRALKYLTDRLSMFTKSEGPTITELPLEILQGISVGDRLRLTEVGIDSCYDMGRAEFIRLLFQTPYGAHELVDWLLQAKLALYFGPAVQSLRQYGIRTAPDLLRCDDKAFEMLSAETELTATGLRLARSNLAADPSIKKLVGYFDLIHRPDLAKSEAERA